MIRTAAAILCLSSILMFFSPPRSEAAPSFFFEVGTFTDESGVEIKIEHSRYPGVQRIVLNGFAANQKFYFPVFYNAYSKEFYNDLSPSNPFIVRDMSEGSKEAPTYRESEKYKKTEREEAGFRIIEISMGNRLSPSARRALLVVENESGIIRSMRYERSDAYTIPKYLRPLTRKISQAGKISVSRTCEQLFR